MAWFFPEAHAGIDWTHGDDFERHLLLRQVRRRFGEAVAANSAPWLTRITEPPVLEDLGEARLDCADGALEGGRTVNSGAFARR